MPYDTHETTKNINTNDNETLLNFFKTTKETLKQINIASLKERNENKLIYNLLLQSWNTPYPIVVECDKINSFYLQTYQSNLKKIEEVDSVLRKLESKNEKSNKNINKDSIDECSTKKSFEETVYNQKHDIIELETIPNLIIGNYKLKTRLKKILNLKLTNFKRRIIVPLEKKFSGRSKIAKKKVRMHGRFIKQTKKVFIIKI